MNFESPDFRPCKEWIAERVDEGKTWDEIKNLCTSEEMVQVTLDTYYDELLWPADLTSDIWSEFVSYYREMYQRVKIVSEDPVIAIDTGVLSNTFAVPTGKASSWEQYKKVLGKEMSDVSIGNIQKSCHWILNHLKLDTRTYGPVKGLVTGSVQSGKTANMEGLVSMAADYDWNFFIILSGSIDNLRKQTRDRFKKDLRNSEGGVFWKVIDFTAEDKRFAEEELKLNSTSGSKNFANRYVTVCLKNRSRLTKLIDWLYDDPMRTSKLRVMVIDDEADQASINTAEITDDEEQERCAINQLIVNLVNGKKSDGEIPPVKLQAMNYISYTATPYANVLNESSEESLYPKDFICTLPEAYEYFGVKVIFGNDEQDCPGLGIIRDVLSDDEKSLKMIHKEEIYGIPESMKKAISWFLDASAILRHRGYKKNISMLLHTSAIQKHHFVIYDNIRTWLKQEQDVISYCRKAYEEEVNAVTKADLMVANPQYSLIDSVTEDCPPFRDLHDEIVSIIRDTTNILLDDDKELEYSKGLHVCVDNCKANKEAEEGTYLRIVYPNEEQLKNMEKAPVFLIVGGNTLSRGLTIEGLVCSYFSRTVNQADTLMQMARWFGYKKGYELLQRIWMTEPVLKKYQALAKIDMDLKAEIEMFMERGISPSQFGPRIRNIPEIAKFRITAKKKSQRAEFDDWDFCGDSYETTDFDEWSVEENLNKTESFVTQMNGKYHYRKSSTANAFVWEQVDYSFVRDNLLAVFSISEHSSLHDNLKYFNQWMEKMNEEDKYLRWNVAVVDGDNKDEVWEIEPGLTVGKVERTRKKNPADYIDIGSLRSGRDAICDVNEDSLTDEQKIQFKATRKNGRDIISKRSIFNLEDTPLLLIYRIKRDGGTPRTSNRAKLDLDYDLIGISIIVSGDSIGESHARSLRIMI